MDPAKLKVVELRAQLSQRGLDTKGKKELLVERLRAALDEENSARDQGKESSVENDATQKENSERPAEGAKPAQPPKTPGRASRSSSMTTPTKISTRSGPRTPNSTRQPSPIKMQRSEATCDVLPTITESGPEEKEPLTEPTAKSPEKPEERQTRAKTQPNEVSPEEPEEKPADEAEATKVSEAPRELTEKDKPETVEESEESKEEAAEEKETQETAEGKSEEVTEEPVQLKEEPVELKEEPVQLKEKPVELKEEPVESKEKPVESKEEPVESKEEPVELKEKPVELKEEAADLMEEPAEEKAEVKGDDDSKEDPQSDEPMEEQVSEKVDAEPEESKTAEDSEEDKKQTENEEDHTKDDDKDSGDRKEDKSVSLTETEAQEESKMETENVEDNLEAEASEPVKEETAEEAETKELADEAERDSKKGDDDQDVEMAEGERNEEAKEQKDSKPEIDRYQDDKGEQNGRKRKRSPSPGEAREEVHSPVQAPLEDEPPIDETSLTLSWYDSDLNLVIDKDGFFAATPMHTEDFSHMWAGARCSYGFLNGRVYYEARIVENCRVNPMDDQNPHMLRIGWSATYTSMQLGEERLSYGYDNTGRKCTAGEFTDYGRGFDQGDVIGCYLDATSPNEVTLAYTLNGKELGTAFTVSKEELAGKPLFPHILSKNCSLACNFGQERPWSEEILEDYVSIGNVDPEHKVPGPRRLERKEDCEVIMMCGLPGSGKTTWANRYAQDNPQKLYNVLGIENLIQKTKHMSQPTRETYTGSWDNLIERCTRALNKLLELAATRRRNYILDQANVYPSGQRRKMKSFSGYQRKAVVVVPSDEEFKARSAKRRTIEGKGLPDTELMEMKANFSAPMVGDYLEAVDWVELGEEEARKLIEKYNREGKHAGYGRQQPSKRARVDKSTEGARGEAGREPRNNRDNRDHRRNNYQDRNRNPMWRGGGGGNAGRWDRQQRGGHGRHGGYGHQAMPWRARAPMPPPHRGAIDRRGGGGGGGNDRRQPNDRNRSSGQRQGGWGMSGYQGSQQGSWGQQQQQQQQGSWSGGQSSSGGWGQQGWGQQWGNWKGYGQGSYGGQQSGYNQQGYGNGNWNSWNQQYYNQYWGQQQQQQQATGQTASAGGGQAACTTENVTNDTTGDLSASYSYTQE